MNLRDPFAGMLKHAPEGAAGGAANTGDKGGQGTGTGDAGQKVFTQEQVNEILGKRLAEEARKHDALRTELEGFRKTVELLQSQQNDRNVKDAEANKEYQKAVELREAGYKQELEKLSKRAEGAESRYRELAINKALVSEAAKGNAVNPDQVFALLKDTINIDSQGVPRFADGSSMEDGVKKFLAANPHMVKATGKTGSGTSSKQQSSVHPMVGSLTELTPEQLEAMSPAEVLAVARSRQTNPFKRRAPEKET